MKIAVLGDMHLTPNPDTAQRAAFEWALMEIQRERPDALACVGDATAWGDAETALFARAALERLGIPLLLTIGNADLRADDTSIMGRRLLEGPAFFRLSHTLCLCGLPLPSGKLERESMARLDALPEDGDWLVFSHVPPERASEETRAFLRAWASRRRVVFWLAGHLHDEGAREFAGSQSWRLRALDPDKCLGGPPAIYFLDDASGAWTVKRREIREHLPSAWTSEQRGELLRALGITCWKPIEDLDYAASRGIGHVELRHPREAGAALLAAVARWRAAVRGQTTLSVHLPAPGHADMAACARAGAELGAQFATLHPPYLRVAAADAGGLEAAAGQCADALAPLVRAGARILIENNHTEPGAASAEPDARLFGCTPSEVMAWLYALEARLGRGACAMRLDIGHARNNAPLSTRYTLGIWYAQVGALCASYHVHQVEKAAGGRFENHRPLLGLYEPLISLDGFLWAWHSGQLAHGPIILEIRDADGVRASFEAIRAALLAETAEL